MTLASLSYPPFPMIHFAGLHLSIHGVFIALGFLAGAALVRRRLQRRGGDVAGLDSVLTWALVGALVGARYLTAPAAMLDGEGWGALDPLGGNFSILGGFTGGILAGWWRMRRLGFPVLATLDLAAPGLALGTVVGRLGCLAIVEHLGRPTTLPWGYGVLPGYDVAPQHGALECTAVQAGADGACGVYQPVALYDLLGAAVLLAVLVAIARRGSLRSGQAFWLWMAWYGLQRFLLDFLRVGDAAAGPISWNQLSGLAAGVVGIVMLGRLRREGPRDRGVEVVAHDEGVMVS